jgi:hypothetical protein
MPSTAITTAQITSAGNIAYASIGNSAVTYMTLCNYSASNVTANIYVVPSGDTLGNTNITVVNLHLQHTTLINCMVQQKNFYWPTETVFKSAPMPTAL